MTTMAMEIARERQLDWLLGEVFGGEAQAARGARVARPWLAAALLVLGAGVAFGVAALRDHDGGNSVVAPIDAPQAPDAPIPWLECHGEAQLDAVPANVTALRCFDFTDVGIAALSRLTQLTHLDLSGMDVNDRGVATALKITDAGVEQLAAVTTLRWLSLSGCHDVLGKTLGALRAIPQLERLDLTYTGLVSEGIAQLPQLPTLRELVLSHCMDFHGRSLADVAKLPGLRRLEMRACSTVKADDVKHLAALHELRHLDLRDCMGAYLGQTMQLEDVTNAEPPDEPTQDSIGVTDAAIAALVRLPLETLLLDGCNSLTDSVGDSLAQMAGLKVVGLGDIPKLGGSTLQRLPRTLRELTLDDHRQSGDALFAAIASSFPSLEVLSLNGCTQLTDRWLHEVTRNKPLRVLHIGGTPRMGDARDPSGAHRPPLSAGAVAQALAQLPTLESLGASNSDWFDAEVGAALAKLPNLRSIDLQAAALSKEAFVALGASRSLRDLQLIWAQGVDVPALDALRQVPLQDLDLYGLRDLKLKDMGVFESWPGIRVRLPNGKSYTEPVRPDSKQQSDGK